MRPRVYLMVVLLLIPLQASFLNPLSLGGVKPDIALALLYIIGLLTGPIEASLAGMGIGLLQDIGSAGLIGSTGITRGLIGLFAGLLGRGAIDINSPSNSIFLAACSLLEGICSALFMQVVYGSVPFGSLLIGRILPQAIYTGLLGAVLLHFLSNKDVISGLVRHAVQKEL